MGFREDLDHAVTDIRTWAVKRLFEEQDYYAELKSGEQGPEIPPLGSFYRQFFQVGYQELTVERFKSGGNNITDYNDEWTALEGSEVWAQQFDSLSWVKDQFAGYGKADLDKSLALRDAVKTVPPELLGERSWIEDNHKLKDLVGPTANPSQGTFADVLLDDGITEIGHWEGGTASAFETMFGTGGQHWRAVVQGDYYVSQALVGGVDALLGIGIAGRRDILSIAKQTLEALKKVPMSFDTKTGLAIVGTVITTALSIASLGATSAIVGAAFAISSTLLSQAEEAAKKDDDIAIDGPAVTTILDSMSRGIRLLNTKIVEAETTICQTLTDVYNGVLSQRDEYELGYGSGRLKSVTTENLGKRNTAGDMDDLERAAKTAFPRAASRMATANARLAATTDTQLGALDSDLSGSPSGVQPSWTALRDLLQDMTRGNSRLVAATGEALLGYAKETTRADYSSAKRLYQSAELEESGRKHRPI